MVDGGGSSRYEHSIDTGKHLNNHISRLSGQAHLLEVLGEVDIIISGDNDRHHLGSGGLHPLDVTESRHVDLMP